MKQDWRPLLYKDYDFGTYFEFNSDGEIRNAISKKVIRQTGENVILNIDGEKISINKSKMLGVDSLRKRRSDVGKKRKVVMTETMWDAKLEVVVERYIKKYFEEHFPKA